MLCVMCCFTENNVSLSMDQMHAGQTHLSNAFHIFVNILSVEPITAEDYFIVSNVLIPLVQIDG